MKLALPITKYRQLGLVLLSAISYHKTISTEGQNIHASFL